METKTDASKGGDPEAATGIATADLGGRPRLHFFRSGFFSCSKAASLSSLPVISGSSDSACNSCFLRFAGPSISRAGIFLPSALDISDQFFW